MKVKPNFAILLLMFGMIFCFPGFGLGQNPTMGEEELSKVMAQDAALRKQMDRTNAFRAALKQETLDETISNLAQKEGYLYAYIHPNQKGAELDMEYVLSNRRVLKLLKILNDMAPPEACTRSQEIFKQAFNTCKETLNAVFAQYRDSRAPRNTRSLLANRWRLSSALFFLTRYCQNEAVLGRLQALRQHEKEILAEAAACQTCPKDLAGALEQFYVLENRTELNLLLVAIGKDRKGSVLAADILGKELAGFPSQEIILTDPDAQVTWYDLAHTRYGVAVDKTKGATKLVIYDWPPAMLNDQAGQQKVIQDLKAVISRTRPSP